MIAIVSSPPSLPRGETTGAAGALPRDVAVVSHTSLARPLPPTYHIPSVPPHAYRGGDSESSPIVYRAIPCDKKHTTCLHNCAATLTVRIGRTLQSFPPSKRSGPLSTHAAFQRHGLRPLCF